MEERGGGEDGLRAVGVGPHEAVEVEPGQHLEEESPARSGGTERTKREPERAVVAHPGHGPLEELGGVGHRPPRVQALSLWCLKEVGGGLSMVLPRSQHADVSRSTCMTIGVPAFGAKQKGYNFSGFCPHSSARPVAIPVSNNIDNGCMHTSTATAVLVVGVLISHQDLERLVHGSKDERVGKSSYAGGLFPFPGPARHRG